jgi:polyisoprenoid-binding protein YceI
MKISLVGLLLCISVFAHAQQNRFFTREAGVSFYSETPLENIEAHLYSGVAIVDIANGQVEFSLLIKDFKFKNAVMQEHFNENYMESDKFPRAVFKGNLDKHNTSLFLKEGSVKEIVTGNLTLHGITRPVQAEIQFTVKAEGLSAQASFVIQPVDYNIQIPTILNSKIAKDIKVNIQINALKKIS